MSKKIIFSNANSDINFVPDIILDFLGREMMSEDCSNQKLIKFIEERANTKEVGYHIYEDEFFFRQNRIILVHDHNVFSGKNRYFGYSTKKDKLLHYCISEFSIEEI